MADPLDDDALYAECYYDSGLSASSSDRSASYDYRHATDDELSSAERWARYYVESGLHRSEIHRLRAIHQEQARRLTLHVKTV